MEIKPNISEVLSGYDPVRPVGRGGMASIYLYENRLTGETIAVKSLHPNIATEKVSVNRFFHEVRASLRLDNKNIVKILGFGIWHSKPSMAMEYIDGGDLKDLMETVDVLPFEIAVYIAIHIMKGLDYSHRLGIVHRDIKPSNIMLDRSGQIKLTDFGISRVSDLTRLTRSGEVLGTPAYMSPEQAEGKDVDERSDIFSAGVLIYEMLAGINPFIADNPSITLLNIVRCNPKPLFEINPTVPFKLETAIDRLINKNLDDRIQSASEVVSMLKEIQESIYPNGFTIDDFQQFISDPEKYSSDRKLAESLEFLEKGKSLFHADKEHPEQAAIEFYKSLFLDPGQLEAKQYITSITEKFGIDSDQKASGKVLELERVLQNDPSNVPVLLQLVKRYRVEGDFLKAVAFSKRIAKIRPKDTYILGQLNTLLPREQVTQVMEKKYKQSVSITSRDTQANTQTEYANAKLQSIKVQPKSMTKTYKRINPFFIIISLIILIVVFISINVGKRFHSASEKLGEEMPNILNNIAQQMQGSSQGGIPTIKPLFKGKEKELIQKAQQSYKSGDTQTTIEHYQEFLLNFPQHSQADSIRMQLAQLYHGQADSDSALSVLDEEISGGNNETLRVYAHLRKIKILLELDRKEDARWECIHLEPNYKKITSLDEQITFIMIFANLCEHVGDIRKTITLYDRIITDYTHRSRILEVRMLKSDCLIQEGNILQAQRELWIVRDQSRPESLIHKNALRKLESLGMDQSETDFDYNN